MIRQFLNM